MQLDLIIKNGTVIDGTERPRVRADVGVSDGRIAAIGDLGDVAATDVIDATGLIVAPGVVDPHTHYDAQVHWDPHCTNSGTHGTTTVVIGNCGFGFAPCAPALRDRYMQMMERTEQVPFSAMRKGMPWEWETFPEWMDHLRRIPKGVNVAALLPMNALMIYVMGLEAAKTRPATEAERAEMRQLLHEAMDVGAVGFGFTWLGPVNNHTDADGTPMPTDIMDIEEAYNLARVLRERGAGVIQANTDIPMLRDRRDVCAELARISGQPVLHNVLLVVPGSDVHVDVIKWLDECVVEGLPVYSQSIVNRTWTQFTVENYTSWEVAPVFRHFTDVTSAEKLELAASSEYRDRVTSDYELGSLQFAGAKFYEFTLIDACTVEPFTSFEGQTIEAIAHSLGRPVVDLFFDVLVETKLQAEFTHLKRTVTDPEVIGPIVRHPRVLAGGSDGGAHVRFVSLGQWSTDCLTWLSRDGGQLTLEEMHAKLSALPSRVLGFPDRGTLEVGKAADMMIYDLDALGFRYGRYDVVHDLPDGGWRKFVDVQGLRYVLVNGTITMTDGKPTAAGAGQVITPTPVSVSD